MNIPKAPAIIFWVAVALLTIVGPIASTHASLGVNLLALSLMPWLIWTGGYKQAWDNWFFKLSLSAMAVLAACFALTADEPADMLSIFNFLPFILAAPLYVLARRSEGRWAKPFLYFCLAGAVSAVAIGVFDLFVRGYSRTEGYFAGAIIIGRLAVLFGFTAGALYFAEDDARKWRGAIGPVLALIATIFSGSRGIVIAIPPIAAVLALFVWLRNDIVGLHRPTMLAVIIAVGVSAIPLSIMLGGRLAMLATLGEAVVPGSEVEFDLGTQFRLEFYAAGIQLFQQAPWLGYGWADIPRVAFTVLDESRYFGAYSPDFFHFHNDAINFGVAAGLVGLACWMVFMVAPIAGSLTRVFRWSGKVYVASVASTVYFVTGLTDITLGYDMPTTAFAMTAALGLGAVNASD